MKFEELKINENTLKALISLGFTEPTDIQAKCIPEIVAGKDLVGQSSTGSGKTAAFGIPIIEKIQAGHGIQALIVTPTRELCVQVNDSIKSFAKFHPLRVVSVFGGVGIGPQIDYLRKADIVVGTPGRLLDHLERRTINLSKVKILVIDEADKMFEMGFIEDVERIVKNLPQQRQTLLFSATISGSIHQLIKKYLNNPVNVKAQIHVDKSLLKQKYFVVKNREKFSLLVYLIRKHPEKFSLVFCATRAVVDIVSKNLEDNGINAQAIHGGLSQNKRMFALDLLKREKISVLVATDVAARGLDIRNVSHVYNYDVPKTSDDYTHRIGRTARAGSGGDAITLLSEKDYDNFNQVLSDKNIVIHKEELPQFEPVKFFRPEMERRPFGGQGRGRGGFGGGRGSGSSRNRHSGSGLERKGPRFGSR